MLAFWSIGSHKKLLLILIDLQHLLSTLHKWFEIVYGPVGQSKMHSALDFAPDQPGRKRMLRAYFPKIYCVFRQLIDLSRFLTKCRIIFDLLLLFAWLITNFRLIRFRQHIPHKLCNVQYNPVWLYNRSNHIVLSIVSMSIFGQ